MSKTTINNGDSAGTVRAALNTMFTQLYAPIPKMRGNSEFTGGTWYTSFGATPVVAASITGAHNNLQFSIFMCNETRTFDRISWIVNANGLTGALSQCAIYAPHSTSVLPTGSPLAYSNEATGITTANAQVIQTFAGGSLVDGSGILTLTPGIYWVCEWHNLSAQTCGAWSSCMMLNPLIGVSSSTNGFGSSVNFFQWQYKYASTYSTGVWPTLTGSDISSLGGAGLSAPAISLRAV